MRAPPSGNHSQDDYFPLLSSLVLPDVSVSLCLRCISILAWLRVVDLVDHCDYRVPRFAGNEPTFLRSVSHAMTRAFPFRRLFIVRVDDNFSSLPSPNWQTDTFLSQGRSNKLERDRNYGSVARYILSNSLEPFGQKTPRGVVKLYI